MKILEVNDSLQEKLFLNLPDKLYKDDSNWIKPLNHDIQKIFNTNKNKLYSKGGKAVRFNLFDSQKNHIGRIAAFVNPKYEAGMVGGFGFFECINNQEAANLLFESAKNWLEQFDIQTMDGPINFGERDQFWGLLIEGFHEPLYGMNYNPEYYQDLYYNYGLKTYYNQECFAKNLSEGFREKFHIQHKEITEIGGFRAEHIKTNNLDKYAKDFQEIYNLAWATHGEGKELTLQQAQNIFKSMKAVIQEEIVWFVYKDDKPVAFWLNLPDLNQYFKFLKGKFSILHKIYFLLLKKFRKNKRIIGIVFGVIPEYHGTGVDSFMIIEGCKVIHDKLKYNDYEMQWIGDFNPKMIKVAQNLDSSLSRRLRTYRYHFDLSKTIERHPFI